MLYAKALSIGDKIGFFSPSSPATAFAPNRFQRAKAYLKAQGFELVEVRLRENLIITAQARFGSVLKN